MKNIWTIIKKEFSRFFKDKRMVIAVFLPGLMIYLLYSVLGSVVTDVIDKQTQDGQKFTAYVENMPSDEKLSATLNFILQVDTETTGEEAQRKVSDGTLDLAIIFPENFDGALNGSVTEIPDVKIYFNSSVDTSYSGFTAVTSVLETFKNPAFSINSGGVADLAGERESAGKILAMFMPMLMFSLLAAAGMSVAPESIAGEKERGTMATMLITPIKRWQLALGKILSLTCFAMLSGLSSFLGVILSLPKLMGGFIGGETAAFYSAGDYFMILGLIISVVLVMISAFSVLSAFAKNVKESGSMIAPLMIVIILLGMFSMFISSPSVGLYAIPLLGSGLAMASIMTFSITPLAFVLSVISNLVVAAALITGLSFMFKSEKIMFNK